MSADAPKIVAPGVIWRKHTYGWQARWLCRTDLINKGFLPKSTMLWKGEWPTEVDAAVIKTRAAKIHAEMLAFSAGLRAPPIFAYDGTLRGLIRNGREDVDFAYLRQQSARGYFPPCPEASRALLSRPSST